jgi:hypothetical protein
MARTAEIKDARYKMQDLRQVKVRKLGSWEVEEVGRFLS